MRHKTIRNIWQEYYWCDGMASQCPRGVKTPWVVESSGEKKTGSAIPHRDDGAVALRVAEHERRGTHAHDRGDDP